MPYLSGEISLIRDFPGFCYVVRNSAYRISAIISIFIMIWSWTLTCVFFSCYIGECCVFWASIYKIRIDLEL